MSEVIAGIRIPDSKLAREATELLRELGSPLLFAHSLRVYLFGSLRGRHRGLSVDSGLLYFGAVFHDFGLTPKHRSQDHRFEIDSANTAREFLLRQRRRRDSDRGRLGCDRPAYDAGNSLAQAAGNRAGHGRCRGRRAGGRPCRDLGRRP